MFEHKPEFLKRSDIFNRLKDIRPVKILEPIVENHINNKKETNLQFKLPEKNNNFIVEQKTETHVSGKIFDYDGDDILWVDAGIIY